MSKTIEQYRDEIAVARTEIKNLRQKLLSLKQEHQKEIQSIKSALNGLQCSNCSSQATTVQSPNNHEPPSASNSNHITYKPIGVIETSFQNKRAVPRQPTIMAKAKGTVVIDTAVFNNPEHALSGLEEFSHMWIIFHFHASESTAVSAKVAPPRLLGARTGVLATRAPHRPCAIGLSLVRIHKVEGNKIHFLGVDMVCGTPVLDVKPYIPQYDTPVTSRPPTEGISDFLISSSNQRLSQPVGTDTVEYQDSSPENESLSPTSPNSNNALDGNYERPSRPDSERGAPDGQERFTPPQTTTNIANDGIRIAPWISNPPSQRYHVSFTDDALERLKELIGSRADTFKCNIESLLSEDPRSQYVRTRYPDHEYSCVLEDLSISCVFDAANGVCSILAVRSADEMN